MPWSLVGRFRPALLLLPLLACGFDVAGSEPMEAPAIYREWWSRTESCSGLSGNFDRIDWLMVPGYSFDCGSGQCAGHWRQGHQIYIADEWKMNEMVVRHEMLHDLMNGGGHPNPPFGEKWCPLTWETWQNRAEPRVSGRPAPQLD